MTKGELIKDMQNFFNSGWITVTDLGKYLGISRSAARKYTKNCTKLGYQMSVRDIAENIHREVIRRG